MTCALGVPKLFSLCIEVLIEHIDAIEEVGPIPVDLLRPVLERCSPQQLKRLEHFNPVRLSTQTCLLLVSHLYTICPLLVYHMPTTCIPLPTTCILYAYYLYTICPLLVYYMPTTCILYAHYLYTICPLLVYHMPTTCIPYAHYLYTICPLLVYYMPTTYILEHTLKCKEPDTVL